MDKTPSYAKENRYNILRMLHPLLLFTIFVPWHLDKYVSKPWRQLIHRLEILLEILIYLLYLHSFVLIINFFVNLHIANMEFLCVCLLQSIVITWSFILKIYYRRYYAKSFKILSDFIVENYWTGSAPGFTYVTMNGAMKYSKRFFLFYGCFTLSTIFIFLLPLLDGKRQLPLPCCYPFDYKQPYIYECAYLLQFLIFVEIVASFFTFSSSFVQFCIIVAGQYDILYCSLKNILATSYIYLGASRQQLLALKSEQEISNDELNAYSFSKEEHVSSIDALGGHPKTADLSQALKISIADCVTHHAFILQILQKMEDFYSIVMLIKSGQFIIVMCLLGFVYGKTTSDELTLSKVLPIVEYISLALFELFITCHFAEMVTQSSLRCGEALMRSPWYLHMREMKCDLIFLLEVAKRPFHLTAGKVYYLGYERFRTFLTTSFSFITLLKSFDNQQLN